MISVNAFSDELQKIASAGHAAVDLAGLGLLAAPSVKGNMSEGKKRGFELAGLGTLAGGVAHEHRKDFAGVAKKAIGALKHASVEAFVDELQKIER